MQIITFIKSIYKKLFWSLERQARAAGVIMGEGNSIYSDFWSSEPYLITIGNHCQIAGGVKFTLMEVALPCAIFIPNSTYLAKLF